jgi:FAD/FMN-containing dehydrogenase
MTRHPGFLAAQRVMPWGSLPGMSADAVTPYWLDEATLPTDGHVLAYGLGRSYGDSCMVRRGGVAIQSACLDRLISFERTTGVLRCESGVSLRAILDVATPAGWTLPVLPGTQHVTVGGAIANDIHGKNHHRRGTFGDHVISFELLRSDGSRHICSALSAQNSPGLQAEQPDGLRSSAPSAQHRANLFSATIGGLGLTGLITWAELALVPLRTSQLESESIAFRNTSTFVELCTESDTTHEFVVAWFDAYSYRDGRYRGILQRARYAEGGALVTEPPKRLRRFPTWAGPLAMNPWAIRRFNDLYWYTQRRKNVVGDFRRLLFPLDSIAGWNAMYGRNGFFQLQCVFPERATSGVDELLKRIAARGQGSFLGVMKRFGAINSRGVLSFPTSGISIALDFPNRGEVTRKFLADAGDLVAAHGGRIYPAKDATMSSGVFRSGYPNWQELERMRDPRFLSEFWQRVAA